MLIYKIISKNVIYWIQQYNFFGFSIASIMYFIKFFKHLGSNNFGKRLFVSLKILFQVIF